MIKELKMEEALEIIGGEPNAWTDDEGHSYGTTGNGVVIKTYWSGGWGVTAESANAKGSGSVSTDGKVKAEASFSFEVVGIQIQTPQLINIRKTETEAAYDTYRAGERASYPR
jgi:hypothetical protein